MPHSKATLSTINPDVLYAIAREVTSAGQSKDLKALSLTTKTLNTAATPWLYRSVDVKSSEIRDLRELLSQRPAYCRYIRHLEVSADSPSTFSDIDGEDLMPLFLSLPNLQYLGTTVPALSSYWFLNYLGSNRILKKISAKIISDGNRSASFAFEVSDRMAVIKVSACIYESPGADALTHLLTAIKSNLSMPFMFDKLGLEFEPPPTYALLDCSPEFNHALAQTATSGVTQLRLKWYDIPPQPSALQFHIDLSKLRTLELVHCRNIGYLFNTLLCMLTRCSLSVLRIDGSIPSNTYPGYMGKGKIETFLTLYRGLQELSLRDLGTERPNLSSIIAQGKTLKVLELHESRFDEMDSVGRQRPLLNDEQLLQICTACPHLHSLSISPRYSKLPRSQKASKSWNMPYEALWDEMIECT